MADSTSPPTQGKMRVKQLYTYPIKSLRGISLPSMAAMYTGFPHDRHFMLYNRNQQKNMHVSQFPEMCLFKTEFDDNENPKNVIVTYTKDHMFDRPDQKLSPTKLEVSLMPDTKGLQEVHITMHSSPCVGYDMGETYDRWFSERFGYEVQLLYIGNNRRKVLGNVPPSIALKQAQTGSPPPGGDKDKVSSSSSSSSSWWGITAKASSLLGAVVGSSDNRSSDDTQTESEADVSGIDEGISFADVAPYLIVSTKSWENVQRRVPEGETVDISKFRPNIVVEGAEHEWDEDYWAELRVGKSSRFVLTQNCARCYSLNVDYETGKVGQGEAGKILKKLQRDRRVDPGAKWSPVFGRYGFLARVPEEGKDTVEIKVGDKVEVLKRNAERTRFEWPGLSTN
ncbi:hypothetical protein HRR83_002810 [Exophiala dermatitidis]|nr:hypothetical protein HRR74_003758 [Exophiala dermatitidis]KAJ4521899.1 hypothetical protein HRR73_003098 [Exophiala dermatitidis]KAJ4572717.1 hypothetical protein HRR81_005157 [Exophiala dermatitidis]KAJ4596843.1 hypothetical protein HRR84_004854 [Exophiala dermatitidis]KAJ4601612.1 hypothetical protein HRR83_002810 [Exophiala dermatitidis]